MILMRSISFDGSESRSMTRLSICSKAPDYDIGHLRPATELASLGLSAKIETCEGNEIVEDDLRHLWRGSLGVIFEHKNRLRPADFLHLGLEGGRDFTRRFVGDEGDAFVGLKAQAIAGRMARRRDNSGAMVLVKSRLDI